MMSNIDIRWGGSECSEDEPGSPLRRDGYLPLDHQAYPWPRCYAEIFRPRFVLPVGRGLGE